MHSALEGAGVRTEMILLDGAAHGFRGGHAEQASAAMADWFEQTLAGDR